MARMAQKKPTNRMKPISLHPLTPEQIITNIFKISPNDVRRIVSNRPGKSKKK